LPNTSSRFAACALCLPLLSSCAAVDCCLVVAGEREDSAAYVVIGLGVIRVPKRADGIHASRVTALGIAASTHPAFRASVGYVFTSDLTIPRGTPDALVEVSSCASGISIVRQNAGQPQQE
jgi:hypothetical protein